MQHDLIIVGGGAGGLSAARAACWGGADVALVNDGPLGGDCTFTGCVPSKTLLASASQGLTFNDAMARVRSTVEEIAAGETADVLREQGITVIEGRARVSGAGEVVVDGTTYRADKIILATGGRPFLPRIAGLEDIDVLTNEQIFGLKNAPGSLGIIGGGPIGVELAQAFAGLGVGVELFEGVDRVLAREEPEASAVVEAALRSSGVTVHLDSHIERVEPRGDAIALVDGTGTTVVDKLLIAVGRVPNGKGFGLEEIGVELDQRGHIVTDDKLSTNVDGIYAVGDVTGKLPFTHAADEMGRLAAGNALKLRPRGRFRTHWIPWATFTNPEVARIGLTESEAARRGGRVAYLPMTEMDRAITDGRTEGFIKLIAGPKRFTRNMAGGDVLGATIVAPRAGEMIHEVALAMRTRAFAGRLAQTVHAYPTWSYGIQKAAGQFFGEVEGREARKAQA